MSTPGSAISTNQDESRRAAVHDLGYRRYLGSRRPQRTRWKAVVKNMLKMAWKGWWQAKAWIVGAASVIFTLGFVMTLAIDKLGTLTSMTEGGQSKLTSALNTGLAQAFQWLPWMAFVLTMTTLARTVARDRQAGAFEFYFSRPVRPIDYVVGKLVGAAILVGAQLLVGPLLLAIFRVGIDWDHIETTWQVIPQTLLIGLVATAFFATVPLALSSLVGKPRSGLILWAVLWVLVSGIARALANQTEIETFYALDPYGLILGATYGFYGIKEFAFRSLPSLSLSLVGLAIYCVTAIAILYWRVRANAQTGIGGS